MLQAHVAKHYARVYDGVTPARERNPKMITTTAAIEIAELLATADDAAIDAITDGDLAQAIIRLDLDLTAARTLTADIDAADPAIVTTDDTARYIKAAAELGELPTLINNLRMELLVHRDTAPIFAEDVAQ